MRMPELKALARKRRLRGYSRMRRAELIELIRNDQWNTNTTLQSWEPSIPWQSNRPPRPNRPSSLQPTQTWELHTTTQPLELEAPLTL